MVRMAARSSSGVSTSMAGTLLRAPTAPHERLVIGRHHVVGGEAEPGGGRQALERLEIADAARGIPPPEVAVELGVTLARVPAAIAERAVDAQDTRRAEDGADAAEEMLHRLPRHDVERVGGEHRIDAPDRPGVRAHVECEGGAQIRRAFDPDALGERPEIGLELARLPAQVGKVTREMHGVLAGAAADLEYRGASGELAAEHREDRVLVALTGFGDGQHGTQVCDNGWMQAIDALVTRRSAVTLTEPAPDAGALELIFASAVHAPDHGRLRPWRFVVVRGEARARFGELLAGHLARTQPAATPESLQRERD